MYNILIWVIKLRFIQKKLNTIVTANLDDMPNLSKEYGITITWALRIRIKSGKEPLKLVKPTQTPTLKIEPPSTVKRPSEKM